MTTKVRVVKHSPRVYRATQTAMGQAMEFTLEYAVREARDLTSRPFPPKSEPGEPPRQRTGELKQSIKVLDVTEAKTYVLGIFGTTIDYGRWLELGSTEMAARPFLRPALDLTIKEVPKRLKKAFGRTFRISGAAK